MEEMIAQVRSMTDYPFIDFLARHQHVWNETDDDGQGESIPG